MSDWWLSTERMTVGVETDARGRVIVAPPIVRRFIGQHVDRLRAWLRRQPGYQEKETP